MVWYVLESGYLPNHFRLHCSGPTTARSYHCWPGQHLPVGRKGNGIHRSHLRGFHPSKKNSEIARKSTWMVSMPRP
jgi:hypothetical protein